MLKEAPPSGTINISLPLGGERKKKHLKLPVYASVGTSASTRYQKNTSQQLPF
jgi:hypothetical protein